MEENERKIAAGELEVVKASEEVQRRNVQAGIQFANETRMMVKELSTIVDALQNSIMAQNDQVKELRTQLANLQQQFYLKGSVSYQE